MNCVKPILPRNRIPIRIAMAISVRPAFLASGGRKDGTPLLIDSIPVKAVHPVEKACRTSRSVSGSTAVGALTAADGPSIASRTSPTAIISRYAPRNKYTGTDINVPVSRRPRRFARVTTTSRPNAIAALYGQRAGNAEAIAATPAVTLTATFRM